MCASNLSTLMSEIFRNHSAGAHHFHRLLFFNGCASALAEYFTDILGSNKLNGIIQILKLNISYNTRLNTESKLEARHIEEKSYCFQLGVWASWEYQAQKQDLRAVLTQLASKASVMEKSGNTTAKHV